METAIRPAPDTLTANFAAAGNVCMAQSDARSSYADAVVNSQPEEAGKLASVLRRIANEIDRFELFAALRLIDAAFPETARLGEGKRPRDEPIRLAQEVSLSFAPADLVRIETATGKHPARLVQRVQGLFGPNGPLPLHLTEYVFARQHHNGDETLARFADLFHHRLLSLFYRAWANHQPTVSLDRPQADRFGGYLAALCGLGMPSLRNRDAVGDFVKLSHAGIFGRQVKCAEGLQIVLANHFDVPVLIEQWRGHWLDIPPAERTRLGRRDGYASLGEDAVIGEKVWDCQSRFRIVLGPLSLEDYQSFLPNSDAYSRLADLVQLYVGIELDWDLQLILKKERIPMLHLNGSVLLGWTSWLGCRLRARNADDLVL